MQVAVSHQFLPKRKTVGTSRVMDCFGIDFEQGKHVISSGVEIPIETSSIVAFVGDSGSGKSSLMRAVADSLDDVFVLDELSLPSKSLIDGLGMEFEAGMSLLARCGLGEAQLMLRTPQELSDGQRYRYRLALAVAQKPRWIVADEFTATLDRTLAKVIAFNIKKLAEDSGCRFLVATTHEDVLADLQPDVLVRCRLGSEPEVILAENDGQKKSGSALPTRYGSVKEPVATGRTSLGGITDLMRPASYGL